VYLATIVAIWTRSLDWLALNKHNSFEDCYLVSVWTWAWANEHDQIFLEYFTDTWHIILHDVEEYFSMCPRVKNKNGWKIKHMKKKDEQNLFTTKSYVLIQTQPLHNQEICVNWNTACSSLRGMFPLGIETIWDYTFSIPFQHVFYLNLVFETFYV
jgi:hypothetical protein